MLISDLRENSSSSPFLSLYTRVLLFGVAYFGLAVLGQQFSLKSGEFVSFWLPSGLFVGTLLINRKRHWPLLVIAALIANYCFDQLNGKALPESLLFSLGNSLEAVLGAWLVLRYAGTRLTLSTLREISILVLCAAILSPVAGATIGSTTVIALMGGSSFWQTFAMWWSGDALGVLLIAPIVIVLLQRDQTQPTLTSPVLLAKAIGIMIPVALATYIVFNHHIAQLYPLKYMLVPIVVFVALRYGLSMTISTTLIISLVASGMSAQGFHDIAVLNLSEISQTTSLQLFLSALILVGLFISAILSERNQTMEELKENQRLLALTERISKVGGWEININTGKHRWTEEVYTIHEVSLDYDPNVEEGLNFYAPASKPIIAEAFQQAIEQEEPFDLELEVVTAKGNLRSVHVIGISDLKRSRVYGFFQDITNRKQAEKERNQLLDSLTVKNSEMEEVFNVTSHDLRSPLVTIEGFSSVLTSSLEEVLSILEEETISSETKKKLDSAIQNSMVSKEYINRSITKMGVLLDGLLQVSLLGRVEINREELDMNLLMADTLAQFEFQRDMQGVHVEVSELPTCIGDSAQISQIFANLIGNALKYSSPERLGTIKISGLMDGDRSVYCVEDNGIGIAPEFQDEIFQMFRQLDRKAEGEGLGLNIVKKIVERHNGRLWVESEVGKGSKFYVYL